MGHWASRKQNELAFLFPEVAMSLFKRQNTAGGGRLRGPARESQLLEGKDCILLKSLLAPSSVPATEFLTSSLLPRTVA